MSDSEKRCNFCLKTEEVAKRIIKKCSNCKVIHYCSKECQRNDWPIHKKVCKTLKHQITIIKKNLNDSEEEFFNIKVKQGNNNDNNMKSEKKPKKKKSVINLNNKLEVQDLLDKQEYKVLFDALNKYKPFKEKIKNISEKIKLINEYLDDNHAYLYFLKSHLIYEEFLLQKNSISEHKIKEFKIFKYSKIFEYQLLGRFYTDIAAECCSDKSVKGSADGVKYEWYIDTSEIKDLGKIVYPKIMEHLNNIDIKKVLSPQWLAIKGMNAFIGKYGIKHTNEWEESKKKVIDEWKKIINKN